MKTIYIADDGTQFDDKYDCKDYEFLSTLKDVEKIIIVDAEGTILNDNPLDILKDETYHACAKVIITSPAAVESLHKIADYTGFCDYFDIKKPGMYKYVEE